MKKVLYAEDDCTNRKLIELLLRRRGVHCDLAADGLTAFEMFTKNNYSLVPSRYIEFVDRDSTINYHQVLTETAITVSNLLDRQQKNDETLRNALKRLGYECK